MTQHIIYIRIIDHQISPLKYFSFIRFIYSLYSYNLIRSIWYILGFYLHYNNKILVIYDIFTNKAQMEMSNKGVSNVINVVKMQTETLLTWYLFWMFCKIFRFCPTVLLQKVWISIIIIFKHNIKCPSFVLYGQIF